MKATGISGVPLLVLLTAVNGLTMGWFGYDQGVFSGVLISKDFIDHFPETKKANVNGITSSCFSLGAFIGCLVAFTIGDRLGRKKTIFMGICFNVIGAVLQVAAFHLPQLIVGRLINGFGMGITSSTCPIYQAECTKAKHRGKLVVVGSLSNTAAYMLSGWMNYGLYFSSGPLQWRFPLAFQLVFPILATPILPFLPDSPRWLVYRGRDHDALMTITRLWGRDLDSEDEPVQNEFYSIVATLNEERRNRVPTLDVLKCRDKTQNLRRVILGMGTQLMQQFTGVNALGYYMPTLLTEYIGFSEEKAKLLTACNATSYLGAAFLCLVLIDLVGRRKLMMYGSTTCGVCYIVAAAAVKVAETRLKYQMGALTTAMFFLYYFFYGTSYAKVPWVYSSEVNSLGWRTRGAAAATATNWICSFCVTQFTKVAVNNLGWRFYLLFAIIIWCYIPVVFFFYPETMRRTLEDMDTMFIENPSLFVFNKRVMTQRDRPTELIEVENQRIADLEASTGKDGTRVMHVDS